jgi:signal transduction histidine kinase
MPRRRSRPAPTGWLGALGRRFRLPRPTARLRLTLFYSSLFLVSGAGLLAITYTLIGGSGGLNLRNSGGPASGTSGPAFPSREHGSTSALSYGLSPQEALTRSAAALAIMAVISLLLGWVVAGRVLRPVRSINTAARRISAGNLHERLPLSGPDDEFKDLAVTLNDLLRRLEASFEAQRHFVANASHELRTPLTVERTLLQVALADPGATADTLRATCRKLLAAGRQQERLIEALLTLASSERGLDRHEPLDLAAVTRNVLDALGDEAARNDLHLFADLAPAWASGDPDLAECLVTNLISNALRHNIAGGWVNIETGAAAGSAVISVANTGPAIPEDQVGRLFQPFQRLGSQRTRHDGGHGLGLAIVRAIANAHQAALTTRPGTAGGLHIQVRFQPQPAIAAAATPNGNTAGR